MDKVLICRCEEVTEEEIVAAIHAGATSLDEIKRRTRMGMGLCQGKTCGHLAARILARELCCSVGEIAPYHTRPPARPLPLGVFAEDQTLSAMNDSQ